MGTRLQLRKPCDGYINLDSSRSISDPNPNPASSHGLVWARDRTNKSANAKFRKYSNRYALPLSISLLCMSSQCMGFELPEVLMKSTGIFILQLHDLSAYSLVPRLLFAERVRKMRSGNKTIVSLSHL